MPFSGSTFTNVAGATTAAPGDTVQSAVWDNIHLDYATAFTQIMSQLVSGVSLRNILWMNGGFEIWQRGAGSSAAIAVAASTTAYTADRWYITTGANQASVIAAVTGLVSQSQLGARVRRNAAQTGTTLITFGYPLDTDEIIRMRGKIISFRCLAQAGANFSPASGTVTAALYTGTGAVAKRGAGFTGETNVLSIATNLTAGGAAVSISGSSSVVVPANATQAELQFTWTPVGTAGAADDISFDDVQVECQLSATTWTPTNYDRLNVPLVLLGCKRFYKKTFEYATAPAQSLGFINALSVIAVAANRLGFYWSHQDIELRATATYTTYNPTSANANWRTEDGGGADSTVTVSATVNGSKGVFIYTATAGAVNNSYFIHAQADASI